MPSNMKPENTRKKAANAAISRPWPQDQLLLLFLLFFLDECVHCQLSTKTTIMTDDDGPKK